MSAVKDFLFAQLADTVAKATGLELKSIDIQEHRLELTLDLSGPGADQPFWKAVKEAHE